MAAGKAGYRCVADRATDGAGKGCRTGTLGEARKIYARLRLEHEIVATEI